MRALSAAPLGVPGKALRLRRPGGYQVRLRRPGNAVPSKITHPLNIIDFTVHIGGHGLPEEMTSDRRAHPVDAWMTGSCDVMLQVEELP